jgi:hypothetical protein
MLRVVTTTLTAGLLLGPANGGTLLFSSGSPDVKIGMATRIGPGPGSGSKPRDRSRG